MRQQRGIGPDLDPFVNHDIRPDMRIRPNARTGMHDRRRMHSRRIPQRRVKQFQCPRKREIRIFRPQHRRRNSREAVADNDGRSPRSARRRRIFWIGNERKLSGPSLFNPVKPANLRVRRPILKTHFKSRSDSREFHWMMWSDAEVNRTPLQRSPNGMQCVVRAVY